MNRERFRISAPAVVALALIYYLSPVDKLLAVLLPVLVHELGHILALRLLGLRICHFRVEMKGLCIGYRGYAGALGHTLAAAAGPAFGLFYALGASLLAGRHQSAWLERSVGRNPGRARFGHCFSCCGDYSAGPGSLSDVLWAWSGPGAGSSMAAAFHRPAGAAGTLSCSLNLFLCHLLVGKQCHIR